MLINTSAHAYIGAVSPDLPYDPLKEFSPVAPLTEQAYVFVTGRDSGTGTLHDLKAAAAARPGELTFGSTGAGTGSHLGAALLNLEAGLTAVHRLTTSCSGARRSRHLSQRRIGTCPGHEAGEIGNDEEEARPSLGDERLADLTPRRKKQQCPFTRSARRFTGRSGVTVTSSVSGDLAPGANVRRLRSHPDIGTMHVFCRPSGNRHDAGRAPRRRVLTSGRSSSGSRR